jgi:hypothetical protein
MRKIMFVAHLFAASFLLSQHSFAAEVCSAAELHQVYWYFDERPEGYRLSDDIWLEEGSPWDKIQRTMSTFAKTRTCKFDPNNSELSDYRTISSEPGFLHFYQKGNREVVLLVRVDEDDFSVDKIWARLKEKSEDEQ